MNTEFNFTKRALENLPSVKTRTRFRDAGSKTSVLGLQLTVTPLGKKTFYYRRKFNGKDVEVKLGTFPEMTVENARRSAREASTDFDSGINPNERKQKLRDSLTFNELFEFYTQSFLLDIKAKKRRETSLKGFEARYRLHIKPRIGSCQIEGFSVADAKSLLRKILLDKGYGIHNHCLTLLKSMFNRADVTFNPFAKIQKVDESLHRRERTLSTEELKSLFNSMEVELQIYQDVIMMLLLTGQRKSCVFSMQWSEINHSNKTWVIPINKIKSKKPHVVPLSNEAMAILERRSSEAKAGQEFVFPSDNPIAKSGHITDKSGKGGFWRRIIERAGLYHEDHEKSIRIHDLRRTIATMQVSNGGSLQATSKLLGHSSIAITSSTYAHLSIESVRAELEKTTALIVDNSDPLLSLKRQLKDLTDEQKVELIEFLQVA